MNFFDKIKNGVDKVHKYSDENKAAKQNMPLSITILNDSWALLVVIAFVLLGAVGNMWHPGWLVFLLIPIYYMTAECIKHKNPYLFPMPFIAIGAFLLVGFILKEWHPYWAILLSIPLYYVAVAVITKGSWAIVIDILVPIFVVCAFLLLGFLADAWHPGWVVFFAIPLYYTVKGSVVKYNKRNKYDDID